jgi:hypothetical protein
MNDDIEHDLEMTFSNICEKCEHHTECDERDSWIAEEQFQKCSDAGCTVYEDDEFFIYTAQIDYAERKAEEKKGDR